MGGKHHESLFTKFYQSHVLPNKYKVDKRRAHLSCLIRNNEMSRSEALEILQAPTYSNEDLAIERPYVLKNLVLVKVNLIISWKQMLSLMRPIKTRNLSRIL